MKKLVHLFFSFPTFFGLLSGYGILLAVATFLENDFGTSSIKALIYHALWFDVLHCAMGVQLLGMIVKYKMWKKEKLPMLFFHGAFIVILLGAGITRYFGFEGILHIREGKSETRMLSSEPYVQVKVMDADGKRLGSLEYQKYFSTTPFGNNYFSKTIPLSNGETVDIAFNRYTPPLKKGQYAKIELLVYYKKGRSVLSLVGGDMRKGYEQKVQLDEVSIVAEYGSKVHELPFSIHLEDFVLGKYPGSSMPSHYESLVKVVDEQESFDYRIFMNHVLDYKGFRFFQSSYDPDELGTVLSVNRDPGKWPTYLGYLLLALSLFWSIFSQKGRAAILLDSLNKKVTPVLLLIVFSGWIQPIMADENTFLQSYASSTKEHAKSFESLLLQSSDGRIKPLETFSSEVLYKLSRQKSLQGLSATQVILGMVAFPDTFHAIRMIKVTHPGIKKMLQMAPKESLASYNAFFTKEGSYRLSAHVNEAHRKKPAEQNQFDKDILRIDERLSIAYMVYGSSFLRIFPKKGDTNNKWYAPIEAVGQFSSEDAKEVQSIITDIIISFQEFDTPSLQATAQKARLHVNQIQHAITPHLVPPSWKINLEIFYNKLSLFSTLSTLYLLSGLISMGVVLFALVKPSKKPSFLFAKLPWLLGVGIVIHTLGLGIRALISGHAPWSDTYETMIFIALMTLCMGAVVAKRSPIAASASLFMAGIILFGAHLSFIDPHITTLVPVLKSYWLTIHVSVITASYGFFTFSAFLGLLTLVLFVGRIFIRQGLTQSIVNLSSVNELSIIIGLALLTIGNFLGGVWANESWGRYWGWDPKETWALISIVAYTLIAHLRFALPKTSYHYWFSVASIAGIFFILMTYFGVNFYLSGLHSYATGDPVPVPMELYAFVGICITLSFGAYYGHCKGGGK
jgi:cytochrome c-type biogenesis protein CcsB